MEKVNVLIVDNDDDHRISLKRIFEMEKYRERYNTFEAATQDEARAILDKNNVIHLAIIDIRLENDNDPKDDSGLKFAQSIDPVIARVIITAYAPIDIPSKSFPFKSWIPIDEKKNNFIEVYLVEKSDDSQNLIDIIELALKQFEIFPKRRIAVLTSGGDAPGMNSAIRAIVRIAMNKNIEVIGVKGGFTGLVNNQMDTLAWNEVSGISSLGGTILGTARDPDFKLPEIRDKAISNILNKQISGLIVIGGDGSMKGAEALADDLKKKDKTLQTVAIPGTIDNDLWGTDMSLGVDSASNAMIELLRNMVQPALALNRIFVCEVMGRYTGFLAIQAAMGVGADAVIIPETVVQMLPNYQQIKRPWRKLLDIDVTYENFDQEISQIDILLKRAFKLGKQYGFIVFGEGLRLLTKKRTDKIDGALIRKYLEMKIEKWPGHSVKPDVRDQVLGYPPRGVPPYRFDIWLGEILGKAAVECIEANRSKVMVGWSEKKGVFETPFDEVIEKSNRPPNEIWADRLEWQKLLTQQKDVAKAPKS